MSGSGVQNPLYFAYFAHCLRLAVDARQHKDTQTGDRVSFYHVLSCSIQLRSPHENRPFTWIEHGFARHEGASSSSSCTLRDSRSRTSRLDLACLRGLPHDSLGSWEEHSKIVESYLSIYLSHSSINLSIDLSIDPLSYLLSYLILFVLIYYPIFDPNFHPNFYFLPNPILSIVYLSLNHAFIIPLWTHWGTQGRPFYSG